MAADLHACCADLVVNAHDLRFTLSPEGRERLIQDERFLQGPWHLLHADVGPNRRDFRSINGVFGRGSLQIVVSEPSGRAYADVDRHNTQDLVNIVGHVFGAVIPGWFKRKKAA